jgi:hypothetical protein
VLEAGAATTFGDLLNRALLEHGSRSINRAIDRVRRAVTLIDETLERVPSDWWAMAEVDPSVLERCLRDRARRLPTIVDVKKWEGLANDIRGGQILDI